MIPPQRQSMFMRHFAVHVPAGHGVHCVDAVDANIPAHITKVLLGRQVIFKIATPAALHLRDTAGKQWTMPQRSTSRMRIARSLMNCWKGCTILFSKTNNCRLKSQSFMFILAPAGHDKHADAPPDDEKVPVTQRTYFKSYEMSQ